MGGDRTFWLEDLQVRKYFWRSKFSVVQDHLYHVPSLAGLSNRRVDHEIWLFIPPCPIAVLLAIRIFRTSIA